ncbi:MAG: hypothetical protein ACRCVT_15240 [Leadbetterella sp.]
MEVQDLHVPTGRAIQEFYKKNKFGEDGGINDKYAWIKFGFFSVPIPNTEGRKRNVYLHDVNHLIAGYGTNWQGESSVSAWEIASGGWKDQYMPWVLTLWAMGLGVVFYPKSVLQAFRRGLTMHNALTCGFSKEQLSQMPLSDLRQRLSNHPKRNTNPFLWMVLSLLVFLLPFLLGGVVIGGIWMGVVG